jgi:hypothetical protein
MAQTPSRGRHRAPDQPDDIVNTRGEARRRPDQHSGPRKPRAKKAAPVSAVPVTAPLPPPRVGGGDTRRRGERARVLREEASAAANRSALRAASGGKPSITGRAVGGAAAGVATGAVVGGPPGAAVGGVVGGIGGAVGGAKAKKAYRLATRTNGPQRRVLVVEFAICIVIAALSPLTDRRKEEGPGTYMKRLTAIMGVFLVLALVSGMGRTASRAAAGIGGLMTVALMVSERDLFSKIAGIFRTGGGTPDAGTGPSVGELAGGALGDVQVEV